ELEDRLPNASVLIRNRQGDRVDAGRRVGMTATHGAGTVRFGHKSRGGEVPSPQSKTTVCVSSMPGSVKAAPAVARELIGTGARDAVIAWTVGATLAMVTVTPAVFVRPPASVTVRVAG